MNLLEFDLFEGYPKPTAKWTRNGEVVRSTPRHIFETKECHTTLTITGLTLEDAGVYQLSLENEIGSDTASIANTGAI